jgi:hypothetical protein
MSVMSFSRGWPIVYAKRQWIYLDTGNPIDDRRPCARCGRKPTAEGFDACMGRIDGAASACCGHGVEKPYVVYQAREASSASASKEDRTP